MNNYLDEFLNVYWLRPETAVWRARDCARLEHLAIEAPSLDFGCGDGMFSFLCFGKGALAPGYDAYYDVAHTAEFFSDKDVYDFHAEHDRLRIAKTPEMSFTYGLDHKENLLAKAKRLNFYGELICADGNDSSWTDKFIGVGHVAASNIGYTSAPRKLSGEGWRFSDYTVSENTTRP